MLLTWLQRVDSNHQPKVMSLVSCHYYYSATMQPVLLWCGCKFFLINGTIIGVSIFHPFRIMEIIGIKLKIGENFWDSRYYIQTI